MEEKKPIKISLGIVICMFVIFILIIFLFGMWYYYNFINKENNVNSNKLSLSSEQNDIDNTIEESKDEVLKIDDSKELVYNAEYTYANLAGKSYISNSMNQTYSLKDIIVPYINIDSEDATKANNEIKKLFEELAEFFKQELETSKIWYNISSYKTFMNNQILSIIITVESGGTDVEKYEYYTYNFDLNTKERLEYSKTYEKAGFSLSNIDLRVKKSIEKCERLSKLTDNVCPEGTNVNTYVNRSIENYENAVKDNTVKYFLDVNGKLNVIVMIEIPAGRGEFETIIIVE